MSKILRQKVALGRLLSYQSLYECTENHGLVPPTGSTHQSLIEKLSGNSTNTVVRCFLKLSCTSFNFNLGVVHILLRNQLRGRGGGGRGGGFQMIMVV